MSLPLSRAVVDRAGHRRNDPELFQDAWAQASTCVLLVAEGRLATRTTDAGLELDLRTPAEVGALPGALWFFLGEDSAIYLALVLPDLPEDGTWSTLRDVGHLLSDRDAGLATAAVGLAAWHERHPRCPLCGSPTEPAHGGWTRRCPVDGTEHYPRTDPAVIMAITDDADRLLLGHAAHWPAHRFSTLAGYVEPGESLEQAVRREVAEEVGIQIGEVRYVASQPWPFPSSLMLAFQARATTTALTVDGVEVTEARWFTRAELARAVADAEVLLPMATSVARALIESWYGGPVEP